MSDRSQGDARGSESAIRDPAAPVRRNLVFTSAGDHAQLQRWLVGRRNFDLWIAYYGDTPGRYSKLADSWWARKGSKFGNLHARWKTYPKMLQPYDAVMVLDDDIWIDGDSISRLFEIREQYDLSVVQPAYRRSGKISHKITRRKPEYKLRFTEFVEMSCPVFRRRGLEKFLTEYDPVMVGYGTDHWYMSVLQREADFRCAIVDSVPCTNPHDDLKGGVREINTLQSCDDRKATWERVRRDRGIEEADTRWSLGGIKLGLRDRLKSHMKDISHAISSGLS